MLVHVHQGHDAQPWWLWRNSSKQCFLDKSAHRWREGRPSTPQFQCYVENRLLWPPLVSPALEYLSGLLLLFFIAEDRKCLGMKLSTCGWCPPILQGWVSDQLLSKGTSHGASWDIPCQWWCEEVLPSIQEHWGQNVGYSHTPADIWW